MAGHSHAKNIQHRKNAQDSKKAKIWTKALRLVYVSAKNSGNGDINMNSALRSAYEAARQAGVLREKIEAAITRAISGTEEVANMEEVRYNATFVGVSIIIEGLTDNKNRTINDIRTVFSKHGGSIADTGSLEFMFKHIGLIIFDKKIGSFDKIFEEGVNCGALDIEEGEEEYFFETETNELHNICNKLVKAFNCNCLSSSLIWKPSNEVDIKDSIHKIKFEKIIDLLEDIDDVQKVYHNARNL